MGRLKRLAPAPPSEILYAGDAPFRDLVHFCKLTIVEVRLDKWLQVARIFKSRSQANRACDSGKILVNGTPGKPHRKLELGDRIEFDQGARRRALVVRGLRNKPVPKAETGELFDDQSPPRPAVDSIERMMRRPPESRGKGEGRPTKRARRRIAKLKRL